LYSAALAGANPTRRVERSWHEGRNLLTGAGQGLLLASLERPCIGPAFLRSLSAQAQHVVAKAVRPWVEGIHGKLIKYKVPIAEKNRVPGGPTHFERDTRSIKTAWNTVCGDAGVEGATPKTLRHTMLTWLAERGVPAEQRQMLAGHAPQGTTARNYEHKTPDYLRAAVAEIDAFFDQLSKHTKVHLRYAGDTRGDQPLAD
jgi:hypothetical protein